MSTNLFKMNIRLSTVYFPWMIIVAISVENRLNYFIREIIVVIREINTLIHEYNLDYREYISSSLSGVYKSQQCPYPEHSLLRITPPLLL